MSLQEIETDIIVRGPNLDDLRAFFTNILSDQIHLVAICAEGGGGIVGRDFGSDIEAAIEWAQARNSSEMGVYYSVNRVQPELHKKATKTELEGIRFAHVDIDPPKGASGWNDDERKAAFDGLANATLPPTAVVWSGNGWQALWRLADGASIEQVEQINRGVIAAFDGDPGTQDATRILRVPGLVNFPNKKKRDWGRTPCITQLAAVDSDKTYTVDQLADAYPPPVEETARMAQSDTSLQNRDTIAVEDPSIERVTADDLGLAEEDALRLLIERPRGEDRSKDTFAFACEALRRGLTTTEVVGALLHPANAISAHCFDQEDPMRSARRAVEAALGEPDVAAAARRHERARERRIAAGDDAVDDLTKIWTLADMLYHCVFVEDGSQVVDTTRPRSVLSLSDFKASTAASIMSEVVVRPDGSSQQKKVKVWDRWLSHEGRRSVAKLTFRPGFPETTESPDGCGALNLWRGFRFATPPADWQVRAKPFEDHVRWLFGEYADPFLDWLAHVLQRPGELPSFAWLHIAQHHGLGRNWIASVLGRMMRGYVALAVDLSGTLRSGFNGQLDNKLLAVVDEIDEGAGNRSYELRQDIKRLITEEVRTINPKYGRQRQEWNVCRWLIFSNSPSALPLEDNDRRFWVVEYKAQGREASYYRGLYSLRDDPEFIASVANLLLERDISGFNAGQRPPMTAAKEALLARTRSESEQLLRDIAERWPCDIITSEEIRDQLGFACPSGAHLRHALDRAGLQKVGEWKGISGKVKAYAVRNCDVWAGISTALMRAEVGRYAGDVKAELLTDPETAHARGLDLL